MIKENDAVVLTRDLLKHRLKKGDMGTVVSVYDTDNFEVEFLKTSGETYALLQLSSDQVKTAYNGNDILHAREIA